jgi:Mrp family chromosome partitioning ATPase
MNCAYPYRVSDVPTTCHAARVIPQIWDQSKGLFHSLLSASSCNLLKTERKSASDLDVVFSKGSVDLLSSQAMQDLVADLQLKYDYIVVDASPLLAVANPLTLAPIADKIVMIIEWGRTSRKNFSEALKTLSLIGYSIRGIVLNRADYKRLASYGFGFSTDYTYGPHLRAIGKY